MIPVSPSGLRATAKVRTPTDLLPKTTEGPGLQVVSVDREPVTLRVLLIEDNAKLVDTMTRGLRERGYAVESAMTAADGEALAARHKYDLLILDLMLPDRDGLEVCRGLRRAGHRSPILILSALSATQDKVTGLDAGADDYLTKPFEFEELLSRLRALQRRGSGSEGTTLRFGDIELDLTRRVANRGNQTIQLTNKEFGLLEFFMRRPGTTVTRAQIGEHVWDLNFDPSSNVIDVYVSMLRRKIDRGFASALIHTVVGTGYVFGERPPT